MIGSNVFLLTRKCEKSIVLSMFSFYFFITYWYWTLVENALYFSKKDGTVQRQTIKWRNLLFILWLQLQGLFMRIETLKNYWFTLFIVGEKNSLSPELILTQKSWDDKRGERGYLFLTAVVAYVSLADMKLQNEELIDGGPP